MIEERVIEIESKLAHQDILLEELHQVIYDQQKAIDILESKLAGLVQRLKEPLTGTDIGPANERPPHY